MGRQAAPGHQNKSEKEGPHAGTFRTFARRGKPRAPRGSFLIESTISLTILAVIGLLLLKMSMNVTAPRQWTVYQSLTDGYMTYEKAYAQRLSFAQIKAAGSPWPQSPSSATTTVEIGRLPGGVPVTGTVVRTRTADSNNASTAGGTLNPTDYAALNPGKVEVWKLQSILTYVVNGRTYRKVKTIVRSQ
ncbi:MAG: hypothetical protein JWO82_1503 [Akkermansiaceae bacterium]|nr:hypothetical protein [Akkermansiaceae bacterium]